MIRLRYYSFFNIIQSLTLFRHSNSICQFLNDNNNNTRIKKDPHTKTYNHTHRYYIPNNKINIWTYVIWIPSNIILMRTRFDIVKPNRNNISTSQQKKKREKNELQNNSWIIQVQFLNWCNHGCNHWLVKFNTIDLEASAIDIPKETTFTYTLTFRNKYNFFFSTFVHFGVSTIYVWFFFSSIRFVFYLFLCLQQFSFVDTFWAIHWKMSISFEKWFKHRSKESKAVKLLRTWTLNVRM